MTALRPPKARELERASVGPVGRGSLMMRSTFSEGSGLVTPAV